MKIKLSLSIMRLLAVILLMFSTAQADICTLVSLRAKYRSAFIIFVGTVTTLDNESVSFKIEKTYKGQIRDSVITLERGATEGDISYIKDTKYLVYAREISFKGKKFLYSGGCDGTGIYAELKSDIQYLEKRLAANGKRKKS